MSSVCGDEGFPPQWNDQGSSAHEEKIFVSIRVRPLNDREISRNDVADWECIDNTTILFKNNQGERSSLPTAYQFGKHICLGLLVLALEPWTHVVGLVFLLCY